MIVYFLYVSKFKVKTRVGINNYFNHTKYISFFCLYFLDICSIHFSFIYIYIFHIHNPQSSLFEWIYIYTHIINRRGRKKEIPTIKTFKHNANWQEGIHNTEKTRWWGYQANKNRCIDTQNSIWHPNIATNCIDSDSQYKIASSTVTCKTDSLSCPTLKRNKKK